MTTATQSTDAQRTEIQSVEALSADMSKWAGHEAQINDLFNLYKNKVDRLIAVYSSLENSFPIGVINELRDIFSHLTQSLVTKTSEDVEHHIERAHRHMKRAVADAYKYASMAYSSAYDSFKKDYESVDLGEIDNGEFIVTVSNLNTSAEELMFSAKMLEVDTTHTEDDLYNAYEEAFKSYEELYRRITGAMKFADKLKLKAHKKEEEERRQRRIDRTIGIVGATVGVLVSIAGIVIGILL